MTPTYTPFLKQALFLALLTTLLGLGRAPQAAATTFRVNNTLTPIPAVRLYATLAAAQTAASATAGDTLLVEGSSVEYAAFTCTKKLTLIGPGYFLTQNAQNQANALGAIVREIVFNTGSQGSTIIGLTFSAGYYTYYPTVNVDNIAIVRCCLTNGININANINALLIMQNYINTTVYVSYYTYTLGNILLKNNIIVGAFDPTYPGVSRVFSVVENNIFLGNVKLEANSFANNIIVSPTATVSVTANNKLGNLMATAGQLPAAGNTLVTSPTSLFVGLAGAGNSTDGQYKLPTSSPYLTAGTGSTQPGIFGGTEPYILSGIPAIPTIYSLRADAVGSKQGGLNVTIGARVNP